MIMGHRQCGKSTLALSMVRAIKARGEQFLPVYAVLNVLAGEPDAASVFLGWLLQLMGVQDYEVQPDKASVCVGSADVHQCHQLHCTCKSVMMTHTSPWELSRRPGLHACSSTCRTEGETVKPAFLATMACCYPCTNSFAACLGTLCTYVFYACTFQHTKDPSVGSSSRHIYFGTTAGLGDRAETPRPFYRPAPG